MICTTSSAPFGRIVVPRTSMSVSDVMERTQGLGELSPLEEESPASNFLLV